MSIKTPEQIARDIAGERTRGPHATISEVLEIAAASIEADRAQRDIYELIAEALDDRSDRDGGDGERAARAAALIRAESEDYLWDRYIGPMIDDLMTHLGG